MPIYYCLMNRPVGLMSEQKAEIYRLMGELAANGKAVLFVSSYLPELMSVCDRIGVMARGELREIRSATNWTEEEVMASAVKIDD